MPSTRSNSVCARSCWANILSDTAFALVAATLQSRCRLCLGAPVPGRGHGSCYPHMGFLMPLDVRRRVSQTSLVPSSAVARERHRGRIILVSTLTDALAMKQPRFSPAYVMRVVNSILWHRDAARRVPLTRGPFLWRPVSISSSVLPPTEKWLWSSQAGRRSGRRHTGDSDNRQEDFLHRVASLGPDGRAAGRG